MKEEPQRPFIWQGWSLNPDLNLMPKLSPHDILMLIIQLVILYTSAKIFGELLKQSASPRW
jgi:hypothetical protein